MDVVARLKPLVAELEQDDNILVISHQATIRYVVVVYQCTTGNVMVPMHWENEQGARCVRMLQNTNATSWHLSNYYLNLALDCSRFTHIMATIG